MIKSRIYTKTKMTFNAQMIKKEIYIYELFYIE